MLDRRWRSGVEQGLGPLGDRLRRIGVTADALTVVRAACSRSPPRVLIGAGHLGWAVVGVIVAGVADLLDGAIARGSGQAEPRGAFFDSVTDRVSDALVFGGVAWYLAGESRVPADPGVRRRRVLDARLVRAGPGRGARDRRTRRAHGAGRTVRVLGIGLAFDILVPVLWLMLVLTAFTAACAVRRGLPAGRSAQRAAPARSRRDADAHRRPPRPAAADWWTSRRDRRRHAPAPPPLRAPQPRPEPSRRRRGEADRRRLTSRATARARGGAGRARRGRCRSWPRRRAHRARRAGGRDAWRPATSGGSRVTTIRHAVDEVFDVVRRATGSRCSGFRETCAATRCPRTLRHRGYDHISRGSRRARA